METPESSVELLKLWRHRVRLNSRAHYQMEERCERLSFSFGVASALLSAMVGVLVLVGVKIDPPIWLRILTASISIIVAAITAIATSAKWSDKAAKHHVAGAEYGKMLRKIEEILVLPPESEVDARKSVKALREKLDQIPVESPPVLRRVWRALPKELTPSNKGD